MYSRDAVWLRRQGGSFAHRLGALAGQVLQVARPAAPSALGGGTHTGAHPLVSFFDRLLHTLCHKRGRSAVSSVGPCR